MAESNDLGGDPPCWSHLIDERDDASLAVGPLVVNLGAAPSSIGGAIWSLPHGGDLDANLVRIEPGGQIGAHVNDEVDVLIFVQTGSGELMVDDRRRHLGVDHLALVPKEALRSITAGTAGITYLSIHRRRGPLQIKTSPESRHQ